MHKTFDFKKYVEYKVYSVTTIKKGYGFRVLLTLQTKVQRRSNMRDSRPKEKPMHFVMKSLDSYIPEPILCMGKSG